jgi:hypothetical protein
MAEPAPQDSPAIWLALTYWVRVSVLLLSGNRCKPVNSSRTRCQSAITSSGCCKPWSPWSQLARQTLTRAVTLHHSLLYSNYPHFGTAFLRFQSLCMRWWCVWHCVRILASLRAGQQHCTWFCVSAGWPQTVQAADSEGAILHLWSTTLHGNVPAMDWITCFFVLGMQISRDSPPAPYPVYPGPDLAGTSRQQ